MGRSHNLIETLMGAVVLLVAGAFLVFAYNATNVRTVGGYEVVARFDRVDGLARGADVKMSGSRSAASSTSAWIPRSSSRSCA
jgi:phospholipid/cholesterol/gamma-HCH transport system substrate-binding protein